MEIAEPGAGDHAEADSFEDLVDQAREGQQPTPDDAGSDERDDLGQEQNSPGDRSEPPGRHTVDHARNNEPKSHRNEAEPHDQPECVEDRPYQVGYLEDRHVVLHPHPGHRSDAIPAKERVQDGQQERHEHEERVHEQRWQGEQPTNKALPTDLLLGEVRREFSSREAVV